MEQKNKKSLVKIAQEAGFFNMHSFPGVTAAIIGSVMSDNFEILYFRLNGDYVTGPEDKVTKTRSIIDSGTVDIFGITDPYDYDSCAIYKIERETLIQAYEKMGLSKGLCLDKQKSLYKGQIAINILLGYKEKRESAKLKPLV